MYQPTQTPEPQPRKRHIIRWILAGIGGFIALIIIVSIASAGSGNHTTASPAPASPPASTVPAAPAATQAPDPSPSPGTFNLAAGQSVTVSAYLGTQGGAITVNQIIRTTKPNDPSFGQNPANGLYVLAQITYTAAAGKQLNPNALDWYALNNGQHYTYGNGHALWAIDSSKMLSSATLNSGETTTGWIAWDVPAGHGTIVYAPGLSGTPTASWAY